MNVDHLRLTPQYDNRRKLPLDQHKAIRQRYLADDYLSMQMLADEYGVSKSLIAYVVYPERLAKERASRDWQKYYDKDKHLQQVRKYRQHLKEVHGKKGAKPHAK